MRATPLSHPVSFLGAQAIIGAIAFLPALAMTINMLAHEQVSPVFSLAFALSAFPALIFPLLPADSRAQLLESAGWGRALLALPALLLGLLLCQIALFESYRDWDGLNSFMRLAFGLANTLAALLLMFWPKPAS